MNNIDSHYGNYEVLLQQVGHEKIEQRYDYLRQCMDEFIDRIDAKKSLTVNERVLTHCVLEYFEDIYKVKTAHEIDHANSTKVMAYSAYWILRRHPIQILDESDENEHLIFSNEKFVLTMLMQFLTHKRESMPLTGVKLDAYQGFLNSFFYFLKFRRLEPQSIEMMLLAFQAGQLFPAEVNDVPAFLQ